MTKTPKPSAAMPREQEGISLGALTRAFAQATGIPDEESPESAPPADESDTTELPEEEATAQDESSESDLVPAESKPAEEEEDTCPISPSTILEALLFVGDSENRPREARRMAEIMRGVEPEEIPGEIDKLNRRYEANGCPYQIIQEGAGYRMVLRDKFHPVREKFYGRARETRLSQAAIDVLAIVAYQQPLTSEEVSRLRDKPSSHLLTQLVRRRLLRIERSESKPRKTFYYTTDRFLELFGLEDIGDLPQSEAP